MKTTGFLILHDKNFDGSKDLKESLHGEQNDIYRDKIINYLESGYSFTGVPLMLHDDEGVAFNGLEYLTDGVWIWPNYYAYYLKKYPSMKIEEEFINYL